jgi:eukaryotic-like serine/threonine-protein kinase
VPEAWGKCIARSTAGSIALSLSRSSPLLSLTIQTVGSDSIARREISSLAHPHICRIYDVGRQDEVAYIVMEFLEGETLQARLGREPLAIADALNYATQIGDALDQAHRHGVIHRDLKPGNIMLTATGAMLLDFGLAKQWLPNAQGVDGGSISSITVAGTIVGTPAYMAPEQFAGHEADAGIDVFAFGAVLFEMLTGRRAFDGATHAEVIAAVLTSTPPRVSALRPDAPSVLDHLVERCLAKDPDDRWQTARDVVRQLTWIAGQGLPARSRWTAFQPAPAVVAILCAVVLTLLIAAAVAWTTSRKAIDSIAVLPLHNVSGDPEMDYLSDGLTESVIRTLSPVRTIKVMSGASVARYKGQRADPQAVAQLLHVRAVLVGSVSRRDDNLVIDVEVVDGRDNRQIWGERYTRPLAEIFAIQDDIAREISQKLRLQLSGADEARMVKRFTDSTDAYELYLKGRYYWNRRTPHDLMRSLEFFKEAIATDPGYALAYAGLADAYDLLGSAGYDVLRPLEALPKAKAAALEALRLDDQLAEAHAAMGFVLRFEWSRSDAGREHLRAVTLDPNYATARQWLASQFWTEGRFDEALTQLLQAQALDPLSPVITMNIGRHFYYLRDYPRSIEAFKKALVLDERNVIAGQMLALAYAAQGSTDAALAQLQRSPAPPGAWLGVGGYVSARAGELAAARRILTDLDALSAHRYIPAYAFATVYAGLGDADRAFDYLNRAADERSAYLDYANIEPTLDRLRSDSRFAQLLRRVNLPVVNIAPQTHARSAF